MIRTASAPSARPRRTASRGAYREHQYVRALWVATNELAGLAPDVAGGVDDEAELGDLLVIGWGVASTVEVGSRAGFPVLLPETAVTGGPRTARRDRTVEWLCPSRFAAA